MYRSVASQLKSIIGLLDIPEGDVQKKVYKEPLIKPPRRNPSVDNKSNRSDYMKNYMEDYRGQGKDYQKMPDKVKHFRREQRKKFKENLKTKNPLRAHLLNQEIPMWQKQYARGVPHDEFVWICERRGFNDEERQVLLEDLYDANLIVC
jgi:DNA-directed RNA polymerase specialized sigma54-like protein